MPPVSTSSQWHHRECAVIEPVSTCIWNHRQYSVIEIIGRKNRMQKFCIRQFGEKFYRGHSKTNTFLKIWLLWVNVEKFTSVNATCYQSQPSVLKWWLVARGVNIGAFFKINTKQHIFQDWLFSVIITSVKFQLKLSSEKFLLLMYSITLHCILHDGTSAYAKSFLFLCH